MIFISAGHNPRGTNPDPGACANGLREADLAVELRNLITTELAKLKAQWVTDDDRERLTQYLNRIKTGSGSVVCEIHFNAGPEKATGTETIVPARADQYELRLARTLSNIVNKHTGLVRRGKEGVITEAESHRGSLALMRKEGINVLMEICFITNKNDLQAYNKGKAAIAKDVAAALLEADAWLR